MANTDGQLKILFVVAGLPANGGGFSVIVPSMAMAFRSHGVQVTIATRAGSEPLSIQAEAAERAGVRIVRFRPSFPSCVYFSWQMLAGLAKLVVEHDIVYIHGQWTFPVWHAGFCALRAGKKLVMRPAGSFNPVQLAHSKFRKKLASLFDCRLLRRADAIQVSSETEKEWTLKIDGMQDLASKVFIAGHGVETPVASRSHEMEPASRQNRTLLYLGRIHPMKGLDLLIDAMAIVRDRASIRPMPHLVICGPDENGTLAALREKAEKAGVTEFIYFKEAVYGDSRWEVIRSADCVVLPSRSENFGMVVAEALSCGKPVICTKGAPWECLEAKGARTGWWTDISAGGLAEAICEMNAMRDDELTAMGKRASDYALRELSWDAAASRILSVIDN